MRSIAADDLREFLEKRRLTLREAAKILGVSHKRVYDEANRLGINRRKQTARGRVEEVYGMHLAGFSAVAIAERMQCTRIRVYQILKAARENEGEGSPRSVGPWRCPNHGLVKYRPCVICLAETNKD